MEPFKPEFASSSSSGQSSTSIPQNRERLQNEKQDGFAGFIKAVNLNNHFQLKEESALTKSKQHVEQLKNSWEEAFQKIPETSDLEENVRKPFHDFLKSLFDKESVLEVINTHSSSLKNLPLLNEENYERKPDLTIVHRQVSYNALAIMHVELKKNLEESKNYKYYQAFYQIRSHVEELFFGYGCLVPRNRALGLISDGVKFSLFIFFIHEDSLKHYECEMNRERALDVLINIAHSYAFERFKLPITKLDGCYFDLFRSIPIPNSEKIYKSEVSAVFGLDGMVLKVNALPMYKGSIDTEFDVYKKLKEGSQTSDEHLPILTLIGHHASELRSALLFEEKGSRLEIIHGMHKIVPLLKKLHGLELVHRDIRPSNFLRVSRNEKEETVLIDFGFACNSKMILDYVGTWETASDRVLQELESGERFTVGPADDLESLAKSMVLLFFNDKLYGSKIRNHLPRRHSHGKAVAKNIREQWDCIKKSPIVKWIFDEIWRAAKNCQYEQLMEKMKKVEEQTFLPDCPGYFKKPGIKRKRSY